MPIDVFANQNEIAAKSAQGSVRMAFPDVCHTPPATGKPAPPLKPYPPGVPIPYPNSCHAPDITNGSRTVFIHGKEIALEDFSYFSVSEGDDAATKKLAKGVISGAIKGRCYFQTWSPNVFVEGLAVARHSDLVSHNHSNPSNTSLFPYRSNRSRLNPCAKEERRIKSACDGVEDDSEEGRRLRRKRLATNRPANNSNNQSNSSASSTPSPWYDRHCTGLLGLPSSAANEVKPGDLDSYKSQFEEIHKQAMEKATDLQNFAGILENQARAWAERKAIEVAAKAVAKQAAGSLLPGVGNAIMGLHTAYEIYSNSAEMAGMLAEIGEVIGALEDIRTIAERTANIQDRIEAAKNWKPGDSGESPSKLMFDLMDAQATINDCIRARKCNLVPHTTRTHFDGVGKSNVPTSDGTGNNRGCCPGQTGHHLIPEAMIKPKPGEDSLGCQNYNHAAAPTVCAEGVNHSQGSHGRLHDNLDRELRAQKEASDNRWFDFRRTINSDGSMSMNDAIASAAEAHRASFPLSFCSRECIEAQLRDFYLKDCSGAKLRAVDKTGKPITDENRRTR